MDLFTAIVTIGIVATGLLLYYVFKDMRRMRFKIVTEYSIAKRLRELMFDNSVQAMIATDMNGMILMLNLTAEKLFGYTQEQIIGESILKLLMEITHFHFSRTGLMTKHNCLNYPQSIVITLHFQLFYFLQNWMMKGLFQSVGLPSN